MSVCRLSICLPICRLSIYVFQLPVVCLIVCLFVLSLLYVHRLSVVYILSVFKLPVHLSLCCLSTVCLSFLSLLTACRLYICLSLYCLYLCCLSVFCLPFDCTLSFPIIFSIDSLIRETNPQTLPNMCATDF